MPVPPGMTLIDPRCGRTPDQITEYSQAYTESSLSPADYVWSEEGTTNRENGHFTCTECYIALGQPSSREGWRTP